MNAKSDRLRPSSTSRALASLGVHPCRLAMRLRRFPLSAGKRMLMTMGRVFLMRLFPLQCKYCKYCSTTYVERLLSWTWREKTLWICRPPGMNAGTNGYVGHRKASVVSSRLHWRANWLERGQSVAGVGCPAHCLTKTRYATIRPIRIASSRPWLGQCRSRGSSLARISSAFIHAGATKFALEL